jgi:hypothetical protein
MPFIHHHHPTNPSPQGKAASSSLASDKSSKGPSILDAKGPIGGAFTKDGAIGGVGEKVGGPLSSDGMIGKNFTKDGAIGGTVQSVFGNTDKDKK